jgi:hypothetical protein
MFFLLILLKKTCKKYMLLKQHVFLLCLETHISFKYNLYEIFYKSVSFADPKKNIKANKINK